MDTSELLAVLERYPELKAGFPDHLDELFRIAKRIVVMERTPPRAPDLPAHAPEWEHDYWHRRAAREAGR